MPSPHEIEELELEDRIRDAAPEMLAALKHCKPIISCYTGTEHWSETTGEALTPLAKEIDAAIAKAEGKGVSK